MPGPLDLGASGGPGFGRSLRTSMRTPNQSHAKTLRRSVSWNDAWTADGNRELRTSIAHVNKPSSHAHTHTQYVVRVSDERSPGLHWTVYRRYSEFRAFRQRLGAAIKNRDLCAQCSVLAERTCFLQFPSRRLFGSNWSKVLEHRRVGLNAFLDAVTQHARTCRSGVTCKTRPIMDQFLLVNDMRYTFLNVNMSDQTDEFQIKLVDSQDETKSSTKPASVSEPQDDTISTPSSEGNRPSELERESVSSKTKSPPMIPIEVVNAEVPDLAAGQVLTAHASMPNILDFHRDSASSTNTRRAALSFDETTMRPPVIRGRLSDWELAKRATSIGGRESDPGTRNDLLSFAACSTGRRAEQRARPRRVHLSSAAKRIKKLEEQEARFSCFPPSRPCRVNRLPTIVEEPAILEEE